MGNAATDHVQFMDESLGKCPVWGALDVCCIASMGASKVLEVSIHFRKNDLCNTHLGTLDPGSHGCQMGANLVCLASSWHAIGRSTVTCFGRQCLSQPEPNHPSIDSIQSRGTQLEQGHVKIQLVFNDDHSNVRYWRRNSITRHNA